MPDPLHSLFAYRNAPPAGDTLDQNLSQLQPRFADHLQDLIQDQGDQGNTVGIGSGYRDNAKQTQLWTAALAKYGSPAIARLWVAPPGASNHNKGLAADLQYSSPQGMAAVRAAAPDYGLTFPLGNENWHIEPQGIRGPSAGAPPLQAMASLAPPAKPGNEPMPIPSSAAPPIPPTAPPPSNPFAGLAAALGQTASQMTAPPPPPVPVAKPIAPKRDPAELARALTQGLAGNLTLA